MIQRQFSRILIFFQNNYLIIIILSIGILFRLISLSSHPSGFHNDEVSFFINAQSILATGMDEDGNSIPLYLSSFIDTKPTLYSYLQIPFIKIFSNEILASRMPAFIFGIVSLFILYLIVKDIINKKVATIFLLFLVISPWHIIVSRGTQEVIMSFTFQLLAIYSLLKITKYRKFTILYFVIFTTSILLSMYSYHSAKVFLPLFSIVILFLYLKREKKNIKYFFTIISVVIISLFITINLGGVQRARTVNIFSDPGTQLILNEQITTATNSTNPLLIRVFHNKVVNYSVLFTKQYMEYFSADFLFFSGGEPKRYSVPFQGLFYLIQLPLLIIGSIVFFTKEKDKKCISFVIGWALISPLAGALTIYEVPSIIRIFPLIVPLLIFLVYGLSYIFFMKSHIMRLSLLGIFIVGLVFNILFFMHTYFIQQPNYHPWYRNYAEQQLANTIQNMESKYEKVMISGAGDIYIYFALNHLVSLQQLQESKDSKRSENFSLGKYIFIRTGCVIGKEEGVLYVVQITCKRILDNPEYISVGTVGYKDNARVYELLEFNKSERTQVIHSY